jgi:Na+/melibiose symporter-like transporter
MNKKELFGYLCLSLPLGFIGLPIYIYLPDFYNQNYGISLQEIAIILLLTRLFDTLLDPIIGIVSDNLCQLKNKKFRTKIITFLSPFLGIALFSLLVPCYFKRYFSNYFSCNSFGIKTSLFFSLFFTYTLFSIIWINYQSLAVSFTRDYNLKTKIIALREAFFTLGIIISSILPFLLEKFYSPVKSMQIIGIFYLILICCCAAFFSKFCTVNLNATAGNQDYSKQFLQAKSDNCTLNLQLKNIFFNRKLVSFLLIFFLNAIASSIPASLITFYVDRVLDLQNKTGLFLILYFMGLIGGIAFWTVLAQKINSKIKAWLASSMLVIAVFPFCFFLGAKNLISYSLICVLSGFGFAGDFCISYSVLTDIIQQQKFLQKESTIFAITNFLIKISFTISSVILIYTLGTIRDHGFFIPEKEFLSYSYAVLPCFFKVAAFFMLFKFFKKYENT